MGNLALNPIKHAYPAATQVDAPLADTPDLQVLECPPSKRQALGHASALGGLSLQIVMQFAGEDEGIFVASVCSIWKESYESTFKEEEEIYTQRAAGVTSLSRIHWVWSEWEHLSPGRLCLPFYGACQTDASWYVGKYSPSTIVREAISDELLKISGEYLLYGAVASGRTSLVDELWDRYLPGLIEQDKLHGLPQLGSDAAAFGHLAIFARIWAKLDGPDQLRYCGGDAANAAASEGFLHILEFLSLTDWWNVTGDNGPPEEIGRNAASHAQVEVLRWLHDHGLAFDEQLALVAAVNGDVATIEYLLTSGCPFVAKDLISCCVQHGNVDALRWCDVRLRPRQWKPDLLQKWLLLAGTYDQKGVAKFLLEQGAVWPDIGEMFGEAIDCHEVNDYYIQEKSTIRCIWSGSFMEWALAEGCTYGTWTVSTCARLIKDTDWDQEWDRSLFNNVVWAHAHGAPCACPRESPNF